MDFMKFMDVHAPFLWFRKKVWAQTDLILDVVLYPSDEYVHHCFTCKKAIGICPLDSIVIFEVETSGLVQ